MGVGLRQDIAVKCRQNAQHGAQCPGTVHTVGISGNLDRPGQRAAVIFRGFGQRKGSKVLSIFCQSIHQRFLICILAFGILAEFFQHVLHDDCTGLVFRIFHQHVVRHIAESARFLARLQHLHNHLPADVIGEMLLQRHKNHIQQVVCRTCPVIQQKEFCHFYGLEPQADRNFVKYCIRTESSGRKLTVQHRFPAQHTAAFLLTELAKAFLHHCGGLIGIAAAPRGRSLFPQFRRQQLRCILLQCTAHHDARGHERFLCTQRRHQRIYAGNSGIAVFQRQPHPALHPVICCRSD